MNTNNQQYIQHTASAAPSLCFSLRVSYAVVVEFTCMLFMCRLLSCLVCVIVCCLISAILCVLASAAPSFLLNYLFAMLCLCVRLMCYCSS